MAKSIIPEIVPPEPHSELVEEGSFSSPPCFMHEVAPEYLGYMSCEEVAALLGELRAIEAEGADGSRGKMAEMLRQSLPCIFPSRIRDELEELLHECEKTAESGADEAESC